MSTHPLVILRFVQRKVSVSNVTKSAQVLETVLAGQSYSITIKATDASGSSSQTIVEVTVTPGPNIRPPYFDKLVYDVQVTKNETSTGSLNKKLLR